ncbi:MAG: hypothetical protein HC835_00275 [Oscillatoriales cyanobacterium RM2_1_1]|nr:hypothetical protein [Oscillatoriales cyanobacterium SM2_3_0]NJO44185.1 hypothetical protein [Oscillatoriales cyanobacterium RM2_1_1]
MAEQQDDSAFTQDERFLVKSPQLEEIEFAKSIREPLSSHWRTTPPRFLSPWRQ